MKKPNALPWEKIADCLIRFLLTAILFAARTKGDYVPLGLAMISASGGGMPGLSALLGGFCGAWLFLPFSVALRALAVGILLCAAARAFADAPFFRKPYFRPLLTAAFHLAVEFAYLFHSPAAQAAWCFLSAALAAIGTQFFRLAWEGTDAQRRRGLTALVIAVVTALSSMTLGDTGFAPGRVAAVLLALFASFERPLADALPAALAVGFGQDVTALGAAFPHTVLYGFGAAAVSLAAPKRRIPAALLFLLPTVLLVLPMPQETGVPILLEGVCGTLVFLLLPGNLFRGKRIAEPKGRAGRITGAAVRERLSDSAAALRELSESVRAPSGGAEENPAAVFRRASERVCRSCSLNNLCWEREYNRTCAALNDATPLLLQCGRVRSEQLPSYFTDRCLRLSTFLAAANEELNAYLLRRAYESRLSAARSLSAAPYACVSELLEDTAAQLAQSAAAPAAAAVHLPYQIGAALRPRSGQTVSGDSMSTFETEGGALCLLLADGMGSGEEAQRESALAVRLLERFLRSGVEALPALKTLNGAFCLRGETSGAFTTVDLFRISLRNGEAALYKYGAAPSYVKHGGRVRRITCTCLPAGLQDSALPPETTCLRLDGDSFFVMVTDGVADGLDDEWLQDLLAGWEGGDPQQLVSAILSGSFDHKGTEDDGGVLALYLPPFEDGGIQEL